MKNTYTKEEHDKIVSDLHIEYKKVIAEIITTLKNKYANELIIQRTIVTHAPDKHITPSEFHERQRGKE